MAVYKIHFKKSVENDLLSLAKEDMRKVMKKIERLALNPLPVGCERLTGEERYRLRQGRYRILYTIRDSELTVWTVAERKA